MRVEGVFIASTNQTSRFRTVTNSNSHLAVDRQRATVGRQLAVMKIKMISNLQEVGGRPPTLGGRPPPPASTIQVAVQGIAGVGLTSYSAHLFYDYK